jgi:hypothetical protein
MFYRDKAKLPETYEEIHAFVISYNLLSKVQTGHSWLNLSFVERCVSDYKGNIENQKISFHEFLFQQQQEQFKSTYPQDTDHIWLLVYSTKVTKNIIVDKKEVVVPLLPRFEPFILDIKMLNQGWCGEYLKNMRKYILISGDENKRTMIENVLNIIKEKELPKT